VTVAILGILAVIAIPVFGGISETAAQAKVDTAANQTYTSGFSVRSDGRSVSTMTVSERYNAEDDRLRTAVMDHPTLPGEVCAWARWTVQDSGVDTKVVGEGCDEVAAPEGFEGAVEYDPNNPDGENPDDGSGSEDGEEEGAEAPVGSITLDRRQVRGELAGNRVSLNSASSTFPVDPKTGEFTISGVYNSITGQENPYGFLYVGADQTDDGMYFNYEVLELIG
jgi:hypothetical protein